VSEKNLEGIRVLDFSRVLAGPYLTQMLCDLGAEVIKIEQPGIGADERHLNPIRKNQSGYFMMLNRGKKSVTLNLKDQRAKEIIFAIARQCDIIVENFKPGVMESLGLDYPAFKKIKPDIIMCSISTFGQKGPYAKRAGYDIVAQAMSGLMWMTGEIDRRPGRSGTSIGDVNASAHALGATLAALYWREKTGKGQHIDIALRDCLSAILETALIRYTISEGEDNPGRSGPHHATMAPYGVYDAGKGNYVVIGALNESIWSRMCDALNKPELFKDPLFSSNGDRAKNLDKLLPIIEGWLNSFENVDDALDILEKNSVPSARVLDIAHLVKDPQFLMRDMLVDVVDPVFGPITVPATPLRFSDTTTSNPAPPPLLGQHTEEVLTGMAKINSAQLAQLRKEHVI
jgi:CoA:oxalate CoA-transferase